MSRSSFWFSSKKIFYLFQEHHLQRAICTGLIIPTPEVLETDRLFYEKCYPADVKPTRQMIHMQRKYCEYVFAVIYVINRCYYI